MKSSIKMKSCLTSVITQNNSKYYNNANNIVVGKMKNETCGRPKKGFVVLKSKIYIS